MSGRRDGKVEALATELSPTRSEILENTHRYRPSKANALAKLGITLFGKEFRRRRCHGARLSAAAFDLGYINTNSGLASRWWPRAVSRICPLASCPNKTITTNRYYPHPWADTMPMNRMDASTALQNFADSVER